MFVFVKDVILIVKGVQSYLQTELNLKLANRAVEWMIRLDFVACLGE